MKSFFVTVCLGLVLAFGAQMPTAEACCPTMKKGGEAQSCPVMRLGLTRDQEKKIKRIEHKYSSNITNQHNKLDKIRAVLNKKLQKNEPDDVIRTEYIKLTDVKALKAQMQIDKVLEIRAVLTEDQIANYEGFRGWGKDCGSCKGHGKMCGKKMDCGKKDRMCNMKKDCGSGKSCETKSSKKMCH